MKKACSATVEVSEYFPEDYEAIILGSVFGREGGGRGTYETESRVFELIHLSDVDGAEDGLSEEIDNSVEDHFTYSTRYQFSSGLDWKEVNGPSAEMTLNPSQSNQARG